jgi:uncharacterized protein (DUF4415 family)
LSSWLRILSTMKSDKKKSFGLFQRVKPRDAKEGFMSNIRRKQTKEIAALVAMNDTDIDTSDIPEVKDWSDASIGKFYRPIKEPVTIRIDADVLAWLKSQGRGYQTRVNKLLRAAMTQRRPRRKRA